MGLTMYSCEKISLLPTLIAFQGLKLIFFAIKFLEQQVLYLNNICYKFQGPKTNTKKIFTIYQHVSFWETIVETISLLPTLIPSQGLKIFLFNMNFLSHNEFYVNNMCTNFTNMYSCEKNSCENTWLVTCAPKFKAKRFTKKMIFKIYQQV